MCKVWRVEYNGRPGEAWVAEGEHNKINKIMVVNFDDQEQWEYRWSHELRFENPPSYTAVGGTLRVGA